jgi:AcrR family transcriptional regulator
MSSPTAPQSRIRERLLTAARDLFYADGYGVSVDAIAERAAVAKPTVYAHFGSKEALIAAVLQFVDEQWFAELGAELERRAGDPHDELLAPFDLLVQDLPDPAYRGCILINTAATFCTPDHPSRRALAAHHERMLELFEHLAADAGAARPDDLARQLLLLYNGVKAQGLTDTSGAAAHDARAAAAALVERQATPDGLRLKRLLIQATTSPARPQ